MKLLKLLHLRIKYNDSTDSWIIVFIYFLNSIATGKINLMIKQNSSLISLECVNIPLHLDFHSVWAIRQQGISGFFVPRGDGALNKVSACRAEQ